MAAQVDFKHYNYQKSIVRIWRDRTDGEDKDIAIGTGFLVAPGYVLTCAHVVLQAHKVNETAYGNYPSAPDRPVMLDFPLLDNTLRIQADVVGWLPFRLNGGDIAALKLQSPAPSDAQPLPFADVDLSEIQGKAHSVYGFGNESGDCSYAYTPIAGADGDRFQLRKTEDPNDETIESGYSGAPVWYEDEDEDKRYVIGIIATVAEHKNKAYAIPRRNLEKILTKIAALSLYDVLLQSVEACSDENERSDLKAEINSTFRQCNANADLEKSDWKEQLLALLDRPVDAAWAAEGNLVRFAMKLAKKSVAERIPLSAYRSLRLWVNTQENCEFAPLLERVAEERSIQPTLGLIKENFVVLIESETGSATEQLLVSMWAIADRDSYNSANPPGNIIFQQPYTLAEIPLLIREQIKNAFGRARPVIHLFVPPAMIDREGNIEMLAIAPKGLRVLGREYPFVLRVDLNAAGGRYGSELYQQSWLDKWNSIESGLQARTSDLFESLDCSDDEGDLIYALEKVKAAIVKPHSTMSVRDLLDLAAYEEYPLSAAIWIRNSTCQADPSCVLDGVITDFHERVRQERENAHKAKAEEALGYNLSVLWEDPKIVPPNNPFPLEA